MEIIEKSRNLKSAIIYEGLSDFGNEILDNARIICLNYGIQGYDEAIVEFDNLIKKVEQDAKQEEKNILLSSLYIGKASCTYWTENFDKWLQLFRNEDGNEGHLKGYREFMGQVMNDDISGFAQGAIGGAIVGALAGTPACPGIGTAAGAVSGALTGGMWSAVVSSGWSAAFCASSIQPSLELDYGLDEI